jgi:hypothetical protein
MTIATVNVDVDVDLADIDTADLIEELENRGTPCGTHSGFAEEIEEMFYAFKLGKLDHAIQIAKAIAQEHKGMIL